MLIAAPAHARPRKKSLPVHPDWEKHPSARYAALDRAGCLAELGRRKVAFREEADAPGVLAAVRLDADIGGVVWSTGAAPHIRATSPHEVFDCRLVLALHDFGKVLRAHDIEEVRIFSAWRPLKNPSSHATRHPGALAVDVMKLGKKKLAGESERQWLEVKHDFGGHRGAPPCPAAKNELRSIVCEAVDQHLFNTVLTPNYDRAHENHLHLEITPGVRYHLVR